MATTSTRQRNAVSEGMALGLLLNERASIPHNKVAVDLSFEGAWRSWSYRTEFPQVSTDLSKGLDGTRAMTRADERKQVWVLYWETGAELQIVARDSDWSPDDPEDLAYAVRMISDEVPLDGWRELAREFLDRFER